MRYAEFRNIVSRYPFFKSSILEHLSQKPAILRRQLVDWVKKGYVRQLKKGIYTLCDQDRAVNVSRYFLANNLYLPSYLSLETALSYYNLIPEKVVILASVTTKKTQYFQNYYGNFIYRHIATALFNNFIQVCDENHNVFFIATPEKAIFDFFYFKYNELDRFDADVFDLSFRFQNLEIINKNKLLELANSVKQKKLKVLLNLFIKHKLGQ